MSATIEAIADRIRAAEGYIEAEPCFVSIYRREQCFGGPEEGGWWYDVVALEGSLPFPSRTAAEAFLARAQVEVEAENRAAAPRRWRAMESLPDEETPYHPEGYIPTGWSDGGELFVTIEPTPGSIDNSREPRPHYE